MTSLNTSDRYVRAQGESGPFLRDRNCEPWVAQNAMAQLVRETRLKTGTLCCGCLCRLNVRRCDQAR